MRKSKCEIESDLDGLEPDGEEPTDMARYVAEKSREGGTRDS